MTEQIYLPNIRFSPPISAAELKLVASLRSYLRWLEGHFITFDRPMGATVLPGSNRARPVYVLGPAEQGNGCAIGARLGLSMRKRIVAESLNTADLPTLVKRGILLPAGIPMPVCTIVQRIHDYEVRFSPSPKRSFKAAVLSLMKLPDASLVTFIRRP